MITLLGRRGAVAACVILSACAAAGPSGAADPPGNAYGAFLAARYADAQDNPSAATRFYALALQADPGNMALLSEGFLAALLAGSKRAEQWATQLPGNELAAMLLGNRAATEGKYTEAVKQFDSLPPDNLTGVIRPLLLAWAAYGEGNTQAALSGLAPYFNGSVFAPIYVLNAALIADAGRDMKDAAQFYGAVDNSQPNLRQAQIMASWYARQGQTALAAQELAALAAAHPDMQIALPALQAQVRAPVVHTAPEGMAEAYLTLAGALDQPPQRFLRLTFLRFALQLRPDLTPARLLLAATQSGAEGNGGPAAQPAKQDLQNALETLQPVTPQDALYGPAALQEAGLLAALGRNSDAVALVDRLIAANPNDADLSGAAADMLRDAREYQAAIPYYDKAIAAAGEPPPAAAWPLFFDRGICEDSLGNWAAAEPDMLKAQALSPNQPYVLNYLAYSWALHGERLDQAKAMLTQAVALDPNDGAVIDSLGFVNLRLGQTQTALGLLTQAVHLDPDDAEVNGHLGDAFWQAGQKLQADYQWQRALGLKPDDKLKAELTAKLAQNFPPPG